MDGVAITATLAGIGGLMALFIKYIEGRDKAQTKRDEMFAKALSTNTSAMKAVASSTSKSAKEAAQRNGHLAELAIENNKQNQDHNAHVTELLARIDLTLKKSTDTTEKRQEEVASALIIAAEKVASQPVHIEQQNVDRQTVGETTKQ